MPCYYPITAYRLDSGEIVFTQRRGHAGDTVTLPCGRCVGCRLERSRQWAVRCMHEAKLYDENSFITLTYDDPHLPPDKSLEYRDFVLFMKRLRRRFFSSRIRFYMCGEYGDETQRPHYHACLFNMGFRDKLFWSDKGGNTLYTSDELTRIWGMGNAFIGELTFQSAAYVARYCMKKITGPGAETHYRVLDLETGEVRQRTPEFAHMSLKPGIGGPWIQKFMTDCYPRGEVIVNGKRAKPPRYYDKMHKAHDQTDAHQLMVESRAAKARDQFFDNTDQRLADKEEVTKARLSQFKRAL